MVVSGRLGSRYDETLLPGLMLGEHVQVDIALFTESALMRLDGESRMSQLQLS